MLADSRETELFIATRGAGVLAFNGVSFRQILPEDHDAADITAILPTSSGHLIIGTAKRGLLFYDGHQLRLFHAAFKNLHVTELAGSESDLWVGTLEQGVAHWHGGVADWFNESNGLTDARVYAIAVAGRRVFVGGPEGIAVFDAGRFERVLAPGSFVRALLARPKSLLAGTMDDGVLELPLEYNEHSRASTSSGEIAEVQQFTQNGSYIFAVNASGVFQKSETGEWRRMVDPAAGLLADRNISALAVDGAGRLWVGYFDRGLDVVEGSAIGLNAQHARHVEDDHLFCINRIRPNALHGATLVATANGLVVFDAQGARRRLLGKADGLIADHVTDVVPYKDGIVIATPAGLTYLDSQGMRSLYAFHGLVNNHVYTVATSGSSVLAGTLGGLSLLEGDQVRASYTTATSALKHNWVTAALPLDNQWWIGTYGAGVARMDPAGKIETISGQDGVVVNPNAMLATGNLLLAGTLGKGLYVMERGSGRWFAVTEGLPSLNVTALAAAQGYVYVGTDNGLLRIPEQRLGR
jgi:ligand-binding sensor domain-containing protein